MSKEIPEPIKHNIKTVLLSKSGGSTLSEFLSDYRNHHSEPLRFRDFGFTSLQDFIQSIPDIARVMTGKDSQIKVFGVGEPNSCVLPSPRRGQDILRKCVSNTSQVDNVSNVNGVTDLITNGVKSHDDGLIPDQFGLWSVCLPVTVWQNRDSEELVALFSQAGEVKKTNFTEGQIFIRFATKEEALLAVEQFSDLQVTLAFNHYKNSDSRGKINKSVGNSKSGNRCGMDIQQNIKDKVSRLHSERNSAVDDRSVEINDDSSVLEKLFGKFYKDGKFNGNHPKVGGQNECSSTSIHSHKDDRRYERAHTDLDSLTPRSTLYFGNIESVDDFRELIKPYDPVTVSVIMREEKTTAFVVMKSIDSAKQAIKDLHSKQQRTRRLYVNYSKHSSRSEADSVSGENSFESQSDSLKQKEQHKKLIEMPPLIHVSTLGLDADKDQLECCIYVAHFPFHTLESVLRRAFEKYHVLDVCMVNNGSGPGCTKAFLYLATVYDVIQAIIEMNNSCVFERPLQVDVPFGNTILKAVVDKIISRERASSHQ